MFDSLDMEFSKQCSRRLTGQGCEEEGTGAKPAAPLCGPSCGTSRGPGCGPVDLIFLQVTWKEESRKCLSDVYLGLELREDTKDRHKNQVVLQTERESSTEACVLRSARRTGCRRECGTAQRGQQSTASPRCPHQARQLTVPCLGVASALRNWETKLLKQGPKGRKERSSGSSMSAGLRRYDSSSQTMENQIS